MPNEADTCRQFVVPKPQAAGWDTDPHSISEQPCFTDGRIVVHGNTSRRHPGKRVDYLLRFSRDFVLAVVEAKAAYRHPTDGLQHKDYASILGLRFAYATATVLLNSTSFLARNGSLKLPNAGRTLVACSGQRADRRRADRRTGAGAVQHPTGKNPQHDEVYGTPDFERKVALLTRTERSPGT